MIINYDDVITKYYKQNKILFTYDSDSLKPLLSLINQQTHLTLIRWALHFTDQIQAALPKPYNEDLRISDAINICHDWFSGLIKMPEAKAAILNVHRIAKETTDPYLIASLHAIGQALATIHVKTHAPGLVFYYLTALVHQHGINDFSEAVTNQINQYYQTLKEISKNAYHGSVASFILKENK